MITRDEASDIEVSMPWRNPVAQSNFTFWGALVGHEIERWTSNGLKLAYPASLPTCNRYLSNPVQQTDRTLPCLPQLPTLFENYQKLPDA